MTAFHEHVYALTRDAERDFGEPRSCEAAVFFGQLAKRFELERNPRFAALNELATYIVQWKFVVSHAFTLPESLRHVNREF